MGDLSGIDVLPSYHKGQNDIAREFYLPVMERAQTYDRAVGFFNSAIYVISWFTIKELVRREGKIRMVCSPILTPEDARAIAEGYQARIEAEQGERFKQEIQRMLADPYLQKPTRVLASLVAIGALDIRIAFMDSNADARHRRLFHDKVGVVTDELKNRLVFKGSMNETWSGLSQDGNLESVDVFVSWGGPRDLQRVETEVAYFDALWDNGYSTVAVKQFPDIALEELLKAADVRNWSEYVDEINREMNNAAARSADRKPGARVPLPHQVNALDEWEKRGRRGILEHATGSGKTFTALCAIRDSVEKGETPIILVPGQELLDQWHKEITDTLSDLNLRLLVCGGGHTQWKEDLLLKAWTRPGRKNRMILSTMQTAADDRFLRGINQGQHLFLVADEVHALGSPEHRKVLSLHTGPRLGLSATPRRYGDPVGTHALSEYFQGVVPPPFTLQDAIRANTLTPYMYHPTSVTLSPTEQSEWNRLTVQIRRLQARIHSGGGNSEVLNVRLQNQLIKRARVLKGAAGKKDLALHVIASHFQPGQWWIVYCDNQHQLQEVLQLLRSHGFSAGEYHSSMIGDREQTLLHFQMNGGILVSIKCLDQGVNIPAVSHALILASSKNPREFIQRRGRVLRKAPGKALAHIFDAIVVPDCTESDSDSAAIFEGELARAIEFGKGALNPRAIGELEIMAINLGLDPGRLIELGVEDDVER